MKAVRREPGREARVWLEEGSWGWLRGVARAARGNIAFILLIMIGLLASLLSDVFLTPQNLVNILSASAVIGIIALGQTMLIISGNFDMSVASVLGFAGIVAVATQRLGLLPSILLALFGGVIVGSVNGLIVTRARANPFLVTLGTQSFVYAIALMATQSKTLYSEIPAFNILGQGRIGRIPVAVILFLVLALMLQIVLRNTVYGRYLYAIGQNKEAARLAGIPVDRVLVSTFILCSLLAALGGIVMTSRLNSTVANAGFGFDFESIIAVVLGGTSLFGGSGGALLTVAGVLVLGVLNNTTILLGVPYEGQFIVKGVVFLAVVGLDSFVKRR
ncbi:MAG TPA: ABC transporter permease [Thermomicrobiales bacterium]|nr:ABC transporter permease [Thermomicrobiales bacterium]